MAALEELFAQLQGLVSADPPQHQAALPVVEKILAQAPDDADALKCKLVALINLKRFDQAIAVFATVPSLSSSCAWEKAYSQYRLNCHAEALEVLEAAAPKKGVDVRMDLLRAQVLYRLGRYHDCGEVYGALEDDDTDPGELAVNRSAAMSEAGEADEAENVLKGTAAMLGETADMAYNRACAVIARGDMARALLVLDQAEQLHRKESEEDGATEEEIADQLVGFRVQKAYCKQMLGQADEAEKGYVEALTLKCSDQEVAAVASNNLFALRGKETSLFDSAKKARALNLDQSVEERLTIQQRRVFAINRCLLSLYMNKHKECLTALAKLEKEITGSELPSLVKAALLAREKRLDECSALLQRYATENPTTALRVKLTLAQLQLQQGEKAAAIQTLETIAGAYSQAGVVGSLVKLYELVKDQPGAIRTLDAAAKAMEADKSKEAPALVKRYRMLAADLRMSSQDADQALKALEALVKGGDKDPSTVARLCLLLCQQGGDVGRAEQYAAMLPPLAGAEDVDVQELETFTTAVVIKEHMNEVDIKAEQSKLQAQMERRKKQRLARRKKEKTTVTTEDGQIVAVEAYHLPKEERVRELVEMGSWGKPDPERWLPWHMRSYNKKLVKKRKGNTATASGGAQGGAGSAATSSTLDRSDKFAAALKAEADGTAPEPAKTPGSNKKGKKKK